MTHPIPTTTAVDERARRTVLAGLTWNATLAKRMALESTFADDKARLLAVAREWKRAADLLRDDAGQPCPRHADLPPLSRVP